MSESDGQRVGARPRQVTIAGVMATAACLLLVVSLFDSMAMVRSSDVRKRIADELSRPPGNGLGLDPAAVVDLLRALVLVSGALAAAGAVLSIFVLQRHKGARVGLSVIAVLMLFSASFVSGLLPILVAVAASMLWGREARDWFAGRPARPAVDTPRAPDGSAPRDAPDDSPGGAPGDSPGRGPAGMSVWQPGQSSERPESGPAPAARPYGTSPAVYPPQPGYLSAPYASGRARPTPVTVAAWLTWVFSGLVAVFFMLGVLTILADHEALVGAMQRNARVAEQGLSARELLGFLWITCAVGIFWSLAAMSLAVLAYRRLEVGRVVLTVSAAAAGLVGLAAIPVGWVPAAAAITCVVLLNRRSVRAWFAGQDVRPRPPQAPSSPSEKPPVW